MKRFIALVLSLVMALSLCVPAWGVDGTLDGKGTLADPYIIEDVADLTAISGKYDTYYHYKVADDVEILDLTGVGKIYLNGSFDGNGVKIVNLTTALFERVGKVGEAQKITISNMDVTVNTTDGRALVRNIYNPGETTFENVAMHGYIEGQYNMGSFYNYGTANAAESDGADYTVNFVNATSDVTLVCTSGNIIGGMLGHGYEGANYKLSINMDADSKYTGTMYTTNGGENCYQVMGMCSHGTYILNGVETSRYTNTYPSTKLTIATPSAEADGYYVATATDVVDHYVVSVNAQVTAYGDNGKKIDNLAGMTWPLGNVTITDTDGKVFDLIESAEIVNGVEHDFGYAMNDGVLTIYSGRSDNYLSGWVTLQVNQYDKDSKLIATGNLRVHTFEDPTFSTVSFDANGGSGEMNALEKANGVTFTLPECAFDAPAGKQFKGWATTADGDVITDTTYTVTKATTFYAIWEDITYSVVFDANGGSGEMAADSAVAGKYTPPTKCDFTNSADKKFKGWATTPDGVVITSLDVTDNVTLYAIWSVTVPVSAEEDKDDSHTVHVDAVVKDTTATVDTLDKDELDKVIKEQKDIGTITIDFSHLDSSDGNGSDESAAEPIDTVKIPVAVVHQIAEAAKDHDNDTEGLKIVLSEGVSIEFDAVALDNKADQLTSGEVTISVKPTDDADVTLKPAQDKTVGDRPAYDITVKSGDKTISDMGGTITLSAPYALKDGESAWGINVYYVDENGNKEWCKTSYDGKTVTWETSHLSVYMIEHEAYYGWGGYYPVVGGTSSSTADKTVTSAKTFDAGIGMYVAMSVMAAAGSAVIMGKKRED